MEIYKIIENMNEGSLNAYVTMAALGAADSVPVDSIAQSGVLINSTYNLPSLSSSRFRRSLKRRLKLYIQKLIQIQSKGILMNRKFEHSPLLSIKHWFQLSMCDKEEYDAFIVAVGDAIANLLASESNTNNRLHQSALENLPFIIENFDDTFNNLIVTAEFDDMSAFEVETIKGYVRDTIKHVLEVIQQG